MEVLKKLIRFAQQVLGAFSKYLAGLTNEKEPDAMVFKFARAML